MTKDEMVQLARIAGFQAGSDLEKERQEVEKLVRFAASVMRTRTARILQIVERTDTPDRHQIAAQIRSME